MKNPERGDWVKVKKVPGTLSNVYQWGRIIRVAGKWVNVMIRVDHVKTAIMFHVDDIEENEGPEHGWHDEAGTVTGQQPKLFKHKNMHRD